MALLCDSIPRDKVADADQLLARAGLDFRVQGVIDEVDFDPDVAATTVEQLLDAHDQLAAGRPVDCQTLLVQMAGGWEGPASEQACEHAECQRSFWDHVLDFLLWLAEQILQLLDYILDALRVVVAWLTWIATALAALLLVIAVVVGAFTAGIGAVVWSVASSPAMAVLGIVAGLGIVVSLLLWGLDQGVEWLQTQIRDARNQICGDGIPSLPDWDPDGPWFPPAFPQ